jgi:thioredoxin-like negative regulator of GroEL
MIIDLKIDGYQELLNSDKIVLLDIYTPDCRACKLMIPVLEKLEEEHSGKIIIAKINAWDDDFQNLVLDFNIRAVPTFYLIKNGNIFQKFTGYTEKAKLEKVIDQLL